MESYRDLEVWKLGMDLATRVIEITRAFPKEELFVMVSQMRRSSTSIPYNIAEVWGKDSTGNYIQSLRNANGSLKELETQVLLAARVGYLTQQVADGIVEMTEREGRMLRSLIRTLGGQ